MHPFAAPGGGFGGLRSGSSELLFARDVAILAGRVLRDATPGFVQHKVGTDIVTATDLESEALILSALRESFPDDNVLAEESGAQHLGAARQWCVDPLDGTVNFANGIPYFSVTIGLEDSEGGIAGVVYDPIRDDLFSAERGQSTQLNGVAVSPVIASGIADAVIAVQLPEPGWRRHEQLSSVVHASRGVRVSGSTALDLAWTAIGRYDLCLYRRTPERWDWVAGELLIQSGVGSAVAVVGQMGDLELVAAGNAAVVEAVRDSLG